MKRSLIIALTLLTLIGIADSSYLVAQHYRGEDVVCTIGEQTIGDCSTVTSSTYAVVAGVPVALVGTIYYLVLLILVASMMTYRDKRLQKLFMVIVSSGFIASLYFVYLQLFVLNAICVYCMVSAVTTAILFVMSTFMLVVKQEEVLKK